MPYTTSYGISRIDWLLIQLLFLVPVISYSQSSSCKNHSSEVLNLLIDFYMHDSKYLSSKRDSLRRAIGNDCDNATMYLNKLSGRLSIGNGEAEAARESFTYALRLAESLNNLQEQKGILDQLARVFEFEQNYREAINVYDKALEIICPSDSLVCIKQNAKLNINKGECLRSLGRYEEALSTFEKARTQIMKHGHKDSMYRVAIANSMGIIYEEELEDHNSALISFKEGLNFAPHGHPVRFTMYNNIGISYNSLDKLEEAVSNFNETMEASKSPYDLATAFSGIGDIFLKEKIYQKALKAYMDATPYAKQTKNGHYINHNKILIGKAQYYLGNYDRALEYISDAIDYYDQDDVQRNSKQYLENQRLELMSQIALRSKSLHSEFSSNLEMMDSILLLERMQAIDASLSRYKTRSARDSLAMHEILLQNKQLELSNQNWKSVMLLFGFLSSVLGIGFMYNRYKRQKLKNSELVFEKQELEQLNTNLKEKLHKSAIGIESTTKLEIKSQGKIILIDPTSMLYAKAESNGSRIFTKDRNFWTEIRFKDLVDMLPESMFSQIFRSTIVNIDHVEHISSNDLKMKYGEELKISRTYKKDILERLGKL